MTDNFLDQFKGRFHGVLRWPQLDAVWEILQGDHDLSWYIYHVTEKPPEEPATMLELEAFIHEVDSHLRYQHDEDYCGIVYVDDFSSPAFVKIFDPGALGSSCSIASSGPLPKWILSKKKPQDLVEQQQASKYEKANWLSKIFSKKTID